jgi:hypothetical protein
MLCKNCKTNEAKHPGKTCSLKCATEADNIAGRIQGRPSDTYEEIKRRYDIEISKKQARSFARKVHSAPKAGTISRAKAKSAVNLAIKGLSND